MKPVINIQEKIGKTVGKRVAPDPLDVRHSRKADAIAWQKAFGFGIPKGVYRFRTHEEADQWLWKMIARHRNH
jgi:hypothetical protein